MVSKEEFNEFLDQLYNKDENQGYREKLKDLEKSKKFSSFSMILLVLTPFLFALSFVLFFFVFKSNIIVSIGFPVLLLVVMLSLVYGIYAATVGVKQAEIKKFFLNNKDLIIKFLLKDSGHSFNYVPYKAIDLETFSQAKVCYSTHIDKYKGEDLLSFNLPIGKNKDICKLNISDVLAITIETRKTDDGKTETYERTLYSGFFGEMTLPIKVKLKLAINNSYHFSFSALHKVKFEDIKFNQMFSVKTNDDLNAFYFVTPTLIENLKLVKKHFHDFGLILDGNKIYLTSPGKNLFSLSINKSFDLYSIYESMYNDVSAILNIINEILTNERLYKV